MSRSVKPGDGWVRTDRVQVYWAAGHMAPGVIRDRQRGVEPVDEGYWRRSSRRISAKLVVGGYRAPS